MPPRRNRQKQVREDTDSEDEEGRPPKIGDRPGFVRAAAPRARPGDDDDEEWGAPAKAPAKAQAKATAKNLKVRDPLFFSFCMLVFRFAC